MGVLIVPCSSLLDTHMFASLTKGTMGFQAAEEGLTVEDNEITTQNPIRLGTEGDNTGLLSLFEKGVID
jgi:hypothetical protein